MERTTALRPLTGMLASFGLAALASVTLVSPANADSISPYAATMGTVAYSTQPGGYITVRLSGTHANDNCRLIVDNVRYRSSDHQVPIVKVANLHTDGSGNGTSAVGPLPNGGYSVSTDCYQNRGPLTNPNPVQVVLGGPLAPPVTTPVAPDTPTNTHTNPGTKTIPGAPPQPDHEVPMSPVVKNLLGTLGETGKFINCIYDVGDAAFGVISKVTPGIGILEIPGWVDFASDANTLVHLPDSFGMCRDAILDR